MESCIANGKRHLSTGVHVISADILLPRKEGHKSPLFKCGLTKLLLFKGYIMGREKQGVA
jgi:hypothetical protein